MQAAEAPQIETTVPEVYSEGFAAPSTKLLLLLVGGGTWFTGFFMMPAAFLAGLGLAIVGLFVTGTAGYSLRKSGHSLGSAMRQLGGDVAEILEDCSGGAAVAARDHILAPVAVAAELLAKRSGVLTEAELNAIENGAAPDLVRAMDHVFELILGVAGDGTNCAVLASSKAGKTTFFHGLIFHLATRPGKKSLMIGDYNMGKDNGSGVPQWLGMPIYDRKKHGSPINNFVFGPDEIMGAVKHLDALYEERIRIAADCSKLRKSPPKFDEVFFACDEFQSFMEHCTPDDGKYVGEVAGKLLRARGWKIYFFPVLHNDKADGYLDTNVLGAINLLVMGSLVSKIDAAVELRNSRASGRFEAEILSRVGPLRRELERDYGKDGAIRSLAVLSLKHSIVTSDGTEFGDGCHLLKIPNCTPLLAEFWDWPEEIKATIGTQQTVETYFAARQAPPNPTITVYQDAEDFSDLADAFRSLVVDNYQAFAQAAKNGTITRTKFFDISRGVGFGKNRNRKDRHYRMVCAIADRFPNQSICLPELLARMGGGDGD
jgi:hypothetical protein